MPNDRTRTYRLIALAAASFVLPAGFAHLTVAAASEWASAQVDFDVANARTIAFAPTQPDLLFLAAPSGPLYRSEDGGASWIDISTHVPPSTIWGEIAVSPFDADVVVAGVAGESPNGPAVVLLSSDGGDTWAETSAGLGGQRVLRIAFDPLVPGRLFAGTAFGTDAGVHRSDDGGLTWTRTTASFGHVGINALAIDPTNSSRVIAGSPDGTLRSTDGGDTWTLTPGESFRSFSWSGDDPSVVYAADGNPFVSHDGGVTFTPLSTPPSAYGGYDLVAVDPTDVDHVYMSADIQCEYGLFDTGAIFESLDGGATWTERFASMDCADFPVAILFPEGDASTLILGATGPKGVFRSTDSGASWTLRNSGTRMYDVDDLEVGADGTVYARSWDRNLRATDVDGAWDVLSTPFYSENRTFEASPVVPGLLYESGYAYVTDWGITYVVVSEDGGETWAPELLEYPAGLPSFYANCMASAPNSSRVYAFFGEGVFRSEDRNQTYTQVNVGTSFRFAAVDPTNPDRVAAGRRYDPCFQVSTDGGATWTPRSAGLPLDDPVLIEFDPSNTDRIVVVFDDDGAWLTEDAGLTWTELLNPEAKVLDADWDPLTGYVYLATQTAGVVSTDPRVDTTGLPTLQTGAIVYLDDLDIVVVGATRFGVRMTHLDDPAAVEPMAETSARLFLRAHPNPAFANVSIALGTLSTGAAAGGPVIRGQSTGEPATFGRLTVHDATGRTVRELYDGALDASGAIVTWDTLDERGRAVPTGTYWLRFRANDGEQKSVSVTLVR